METGLRTISAGIPYTLLLGTEAIGFPTFGLLLYNNTPNPLCYLIIRAPTLSRQPRNPAPRAIFQVQVLFPGNPRCDRVQQDLTTSVLGIGHRPCEVQGFFLEISKPFGAAMGSSAVGQYGFCHFQFRLRARVLKLSVQLLPHIVQKEPATAKLVKRKPSCCFLPGPVVRCDRKNGFRVLGF